LKPKHQLQWGAMLIALLYVNYVAYDKFWRPEPLGHWQKQQTRTPASGPQASWDGTDIPSLKVLEDYFQYDTYSGYVSYDMDVQFWSDKGLRHFKKTGRKAIEDGFKKTFEDIVKSKGQKALPETAPSFVMKEMINKFVFNLKFYKLIDADFEIDLMFTPRNIDYSGYAHQLETNQLVNLETKNSLLREYNNHNLTFLEKILAAKIPSSGHVYQYIGGAITIAPELLDTTWTIRKPIPDPKRNALKGKVILRKYYRINQPDVFRIEDLFNSNDLKVSLAGFKSESDIKEDYLTVDTIYNFNLAGLVPEKEKVVVHFGKLVSLDKKHDNIIKRIFQAFKKSNDIKTSSFFIQGSSMARPGNKSLKSNIEFESTVKSMTFDIKKQKITEIDISTHSRSAANPHSISNKLKKEIGDEELDKFIKKTQLDLILNGDKI
jgi:hypothetical protein